MTTALYLRYSKHDSGDSLAGQRDLCREWLSRNEIEQFTEYAEDATSAFKVRMLDRPAWAALEADIRAGRVDHVVARHVDRLTRSMVDLEHLVRLVEDTGVRLSTVWSSDLDLNTPAGRQTARILASVAQGESETKAERVTAAKARARSQGKATGGPRPFGYNVDGTEREHEAALVRQGLADVLAGVSLSAVHRAWQESGIPTARGGQWHKKTVRDVLTRWRNAARVEHHGQNVGAAEWQALCDVETLEAVRAVLLDPAKRGTFGGKGAGPRPVTLMSGLATCSECGSTLRARTMPDRHGGRTPVYCCSGEGCYLTIGRVALDDAVRSAMTTFFVSADPAEYAPDEADRAEMRRLQAMRAALADERAEIVGMVTVGLLSAAESRSVLSGLADRQKAVDADLERLSRRVAMAAMLARPVMEATDAGTTANLSQAAALLDHFDSLHLDVRRRLVSEVWTVTVRPHHYAKSRTVIVDGVEHRETLTPTDKQRRRVRFDCLVNPSLSFDPAEGEMPDVT